jgi:hypothetical protein
LRTAKILGGGDKTEVDVLVDNEAWTDNVSELNQ